MACGGHLPPRPGVRARHEHAGAAGAAGGLVALDAIRLPGRTQSISWGYLRGELAVDPEGRGGRITPDVPGVRVYVWDGTRFHG